MSWDLQYPPALFAGVVSLLGGCVFMIIGEAAIILGLIFFAVGLGCIAAAYTNIIGDRHGPG